MERFSLVEYKKNPKRKVRTRDGRTVEIFDTNSPVPNHPIAGFIGRVIYTWCIDGRLVLTKKEPDENDLFFADNE